ncbi:Hsp20/alpha crystallin family protein [Candidatus Dojkabacteria bacterium]|nr:Hsp20/alpha crystallin family protein [Candidatus Dojkabacteria bacterium]
MAIIKWEPFREMERFFDDDFGMFKMPALGWDMAVDVFEKDGKVVAEMSLPGVDPDNVNIEVEDGHLRISGSREEEKETKDKNYYSKEIKRGSFERIVRLPSAVQADKAEAEYEKGVLRVSLPKKEKEETGKIKVRVK